MNVLVTAASRYGATGDIAAAIAEELRSHGLSVDQPAPQDVGSLAGYDAVVLGSAVYTGHWLEPAMALAERVAHDAPDRPVWLFSSGPVGDPSRKLVQQMSGDPVDLSKVRSETHARDHRMFAGKLERRHLGFAQRLALAFFRGLEGDFRDVTAIKGWAAGIAGSLQDPAGRQGGGPS